MHDQPSYAILNLPSTLPEDRVDDVIAAAAQAHGLAISLEGTLRSYPGSRHWHLRQSSGRGVLELTWWPAKGRIWSKVNAGRAAPWIDATIGPLMEDLQQRLDACEREDVATILHEAGLPASDLSRLLAKGDKRIYQAGDFIIQLWYGRSGGALTRSGAALAALAGVVPVPTLVYTNRERSAPPHQVEIATRLLGITLEDAWPTLDYAQRRSLVRQLAALMEAMHSVAGKRLDALSVLDGPHPWAARCRAQLADRIARARRARDVDAEGLTQVARFVARHGVDLDRPPLCLVHTDIHFGNLLVDGTTLTGLIDFENAEVGGRDRDAYMLIGDSVGHMMRGGSEDLAENDTLQAVRWLQEDYPALYTTPGFAQRQFLYLMLEPEDWGGGSIADMSSGWIRAFNGGWIERWFGGE